MNATRILIASASAVVLAASAAVPALADTNVSAAANVNGGVIMQVHPGTAASGVRPSVSASGDVTVTAHPVAAVSIDDRIAALQKALARIGSLNVISSTAQEKVKAAIQAQIDKLEALKASGQTTITPGAAAGSGPAVGSAGVYFSVMSKAAITTAADHILAVADQLDKLSAKLKTRIDESGLSTTDSLNATLSDMNAKVADAKVQANAALADVADLKADADASADTSVRAALKDAAAKIMAARQDLAAAYKDAQTIVVAIRGKGPSASASVKATVNANGNAQ